MKHADRLIKRILFLEGLPNLQDLGKLLIGQDVKDILECDLKLEEMAIPELREAIAHCEGGRDYVSREIPEDILESEEEHVDWLETNLELIGKIRIENYQQSQMGSGAASQRPLTGPQDAIARPQRPSDPFLAPHGDAAAGSCALARSPSGFRAEASGSATARIAPAKSMQCPQTGAPPRIS